MKKLSVINKIDNQEVYANFYAIENPINLFVIFHGMAEHKDRYDDFAKYLNSQGFSVLVCDHRGHGESLHNKVLPGYFGDNNGWFLNLEDLNNLIELANKDNNKFILYGHSMGSIVALSYLKKYQNKLSHLFLSGVPETVKPISISLFVSKVLSLLNKKQPSKLLYNQSFKKFDKRFKGGESLSWLTLDKENIKKYKDDDLCGFYFTNKAFNDLMIGFSDVYKLNIKNNNQLTIDYLIGKFDVTNNLKQISKQIRRFNDNGFKARLSIIENSAHELLLDLNKEFVYKKIIELL